MSKVLPLHHYIRQRGTSQVSNEYDFASDIIQKDFINDFKKLKIFISEIIQERNIVEKNKLIELFDISFSNYLRKMLSFTMLRFRFPKLFFIKTYLKYIWFNKLNLFFLILKK